jgi:serine/threonine protein kinase
VAATVPPFDPQELPPGTEIAGKYVLGRPIGAGKHSVVYEAQHRFLDRLAAVKILGKSDDERVERLFAREARLASSLDHPNIVEIYELGRLRDGRAFLVMELLEGETVDDRIQRQGLLSIVAAMAIGRQVLRGLGAAHDQKIVHRDLRPENIFLAKIRGEEVVKILDFGVSRRFGESGDSILSSPEVLMQHVGYLAPEQLSQRGTIDHRTDIYAVGMMLYAMLTGRLPFEGRGTRLLVQVAKQEPTPPSSHRPELTSDVDQVILSALSKDPDARFSSAEAMAEALRLTGLFAQYMQGG